MEVINTPTIQNIILEIDYPSYTGKKNEKVQNTGSLVVPEGSKIQWQVKTYQTEVVDLLKMIAEFLFLFLRIIFLSMIKPFVKAKLIK